MADNEKLSRLLEIMAQLRNPDGGCPWDLEQNFETIAPCTLEEAYEVADAIQRKDMDGLKEELGDLLLQVVFHAQMAKEENLFDFNDVVGVLTDKLVFRHPHIFGEQSAEDAGAVLKIWDERKAEEKKEESSKRPCQHSRRRSFGHAIACKSAKDFQTCRQSRL